MYNRWAETGRVNWAQNFALHLDPEHRQEWSELWTPTGIGMILRSIKTEYKFPLKYPDRITVLHRLVEKPTSDTDAFVLEAIVLSELHQRIAAKITEDIVVYDYRLSKKTPLRPFMVEAMGRMYHEQTIASTNARTMMRNIEKRIRKVEKSTWDKDGAVEDLGATPTLGHENSWERTNIDEQKLQNSVDMELGLEQLEELKNLGVSIDPDGEDGGFVGTVGIPPAICAELPKVKGRFYGKHGTVKGTASMMDLIHEGQQSGKN